MATTGKLGLELLQNNAANQTLANLTFATLNQAVQLSIVDKDLTTPPGSPADEAAYIVASGNWGTSSSKAGQIAWWSASAGAWQFIVPKSGWMASVLDELDANGVAKRYGYTGSTWIQPESSAGGGGSQSIIIACSDETSVISAGTAKVTFRMPYGFTLQGVRASLTTAQASGSIFTVDINEGGATILSTKLTIDNTEKTSTTAATAAVISDPNLADDAEITIDVDQIGDGTAKGLKVSLIGVKA